MYGDQEPWTTQMRGGYFDKGRQDNRQGKAFIFDMPDQQKIPSIGIDYGQFPQGEEWQFKLASKVNRRSGQCQNDQNIHEREETSGGVAEGCSGRIIEGNSSLVVRDSNRILGEGEGENRGEEASFYGNFLNDNRLTLNNYGISKQNEKQECDNVYGFAGECGLCMSRQSMSKLMQKQLHEKYFEAFNFYFAKGINEILANLNVSHVILFKDYLFLDDDSEYLKRYYQYHEVAPRFNLLADFYAHQYKQTRPNLCTIAANKIIHKYNYKHAKIFISNQERAQQQQGNDVFVPDQNQNDNNQEQILATSIHAEHLPSNMLLELEESENSQQKAPKKYSFMDSFHRFDRQNSFETKIYDIYNPSFSSSQSISQQSMANNTIKPKMNGYINSFDHEIFVNNPNIRMRGPFIRDQVSETSQIQYNELNDLDSIIPSHLKSYIVETSHPTSMKTNLSISNNGIQTAGHHIISSTLSQCISSTTPRSIQVNSFKLNQEKERSQKSISNERINKMNKQLILKDPDQADRYLSLTPVNKQRDPKNRGLKLPLGKLVPGKSDILDINRSGPLSARSHIEAQDDLRKQKRKKDILQPCDQIPIVVKSQFVMRTNIPSSDSHPLEQQRQQFNLSHSPTNITENIRIKIGQGKQCVPLDHNNGNEDYQDSQEGKQQVYQVGTNTNNKPSSLMNRLPQSLRKQLALNLYDNGQVQHNLKLAHNQPSPDRIWTDRDINPRLATIQYQFDSKQQKIIQYRKHNQHY